MTRTPAAIFDEVLDAWDEREAQHLFECYRGLEYEAKLKNHLFDVRAYREEFREAMLRPCEHGPGQVCRECRGPHELVGTGSGTVVLSFDGPPPTLDVQEPPPLPPGQPVWPPRVGPGDHGLRPAESPALRRHASYEGCGGQGFIDDPMDSGSGRTVYCDCAAGSELAERERAPLAHESIADRAERHAARYTKDDGSAK